MLTADQKHAIEAAVRAIEQTHGAEVVTVVTARADDYPETVWTAFALGASLTALFVSVMELFRASPRLMRAFAAAGRMALSNYLVHSIAGVVVFYGIGFGVFGRVSLTAALALAVAFFAVQLVASEAWLARATFGPAEWGWRMFTYRRRFPLFKVVGSR